MTTEAWIGLPLKRREDRRLLLGAGRYVDDIRPAGCLHVALLRSPHARARVAALDVAGAERAPGVVRVITGAHVRHLAPMPVNRLIPDMRVPPHPILAERDVNAAGTPVAAVVADSIGAAWDALDAIAVEYEPGQALPQPEAAAADGAPVLVPEIAGNRSFTRTLREGDAARALAGSTHVVSLRVAQSRVSGLALEPRSVLATFDQSTGELTMWVSCQAPFRVRAEVARLLDMPEAQVRVIAPDVGGGFGVKTGPYREDVLLAWLARELGRPVKWIATRGEDQITTNHSRGSVCQGELGLDADGHITALRARILAPLGATLMNAAAGTPWNHARLLPGAYVVPACDITVTGMLTSTTPVAAYRGAGRPEACFFIERLMDSAARTLGLDPAEIRRRNFIPPDRFPFRTATGQLYDSGDYPQALERALAAADYPRLRREQAERRARGEIVGVGLASYIEPAALGWESGTVKVERSGRVTAITGSSAHGQGHETTFAQVVADHLGVTPDDVVVAHGDTRSGPEGFGTFGSRSVALGGGALVRASVEVRAKGQRIAANLLEAAADDVVNVPGGFQVAGTPQRLVSWREVATAAYGGHGLPRGEPPGLESVIYFQAEGEVWSFGAVVCVLSVERETGRLTLERLVWLDDAGTIINPLLAEGQLHGGLAQGVGQALMEAIVFDADGQLLTGTLMDYAIPRATDVPPVQIEKTLTRSPRNPLGAKGLGEAGCIAMPPAIVNAAVDALSELGVTHLDMPLTAERVWRALHRR
ncbi:MAG TPA: xanthine dehydrogenase family protein molybdopterin-binding subunit [Methylomirabilota bacterium]|jgi:carbon-monoxide dehydrogenase large subunit|nr:xanthine dehydrogenase family protein molybdopterin-binding subunit [Methylomirabilota bacterium]